MIVAVGGFSSQLFETLEPRCTQRRGFFLWGRLRSARTWQQCHTELDSWKTSRLRALNAVERVVRLGNPKVAQQWPSVSLHAAR